MRLLLLAGLLWTVLGSVTQAQTPTAARRAIRAEVLNTPLEKLRLYRGSPGLEGFKTDRLPPPSSPEDLARAVGARLGGRSRQIAGLTNCLSTAGCFALGIQDQSAESVRIYGAKEGYVGVTRARSMPARRFMKLVDRYRGSLPTLLDVMGECNVVVSAASLTGELAQRYPGILTSSFRHMIASSLDREAEYLVFGRKPGFSRVIKVAKSDVIDPWGSITGATFSPALRELVER